MDTVRLSIHQINREGGTQPREMVDLDVAYDYAEQMREGIRFPPPLIIFDGTNYWLADGFHRVAAAERVPVTEIDCEVRMGTLEDAKWHSYSANATHGLRRTNSDKRRAVLAALEHPKGKRMSDVSLAEHCGVSNRFVANLRKKSGDFEQFKVGRDGRTINTANIGRRSEPAAVEPVDAPRCEPCAPAREWPMPNKQHEYAEAGEEIACDHDKSGSWAVVKLLQVDEDAWIAGVEALVLPMEARLEVALTTELEEKESRDAALHSGLLRLAVWLDDLRRKEDAKASASAIKALTKWTRREPVPVKEEELEPHRQWLAGVAEHQRRMRVDWVKWTLPEWFDQFEEDQDDHLKDVSAETVKDGALLWAKENPVPARQMMKNRKAWQQFCGWFWQGVTAALKDAPEAEPAEAEETAADAA